MQPLNILRIKDSQWTAQGIEEPERLQQMPMKSLGKEMNKTHPE